MSSPRTLVRLWSLFAIAVALVLAGGATAALVQTSAGSVQVRDVTFTGTAGTSVSGLLYVPATATPETPAPAVLAVHGYVNSREMQTANAVELSRRGYVVLALDQAGHGRSDAPAFGNGFNGPAGLAYLRGLDIVDPDNIGLEGHSLGGSTVMNAAAAFPEGYASMVLLDSATGFFGPEGTPDFPRNTLVVFAEWEEFSGTMWASPNTRDLTSSPKLMTMFGTDEPVVPGQLYGSIDDGTARELLRPANNHPGVTHDPAVTQEIVAWFDKTLEGGHDAAGQTWWIKELGTLVAMIGGVLVIFATGGLLLATGFFSAIRRPVPSAAGSRWGWPWIVSAILTTGIPALTFFWFNTWGAAWIPAGPVFGQSYSTGIVVWALLNGLIGLAIYAVTAWVQRRRNPLASVRAAEVEGAPGLRRGALIGRAAVLSLLSVGAAYLLVVISDWLFKSDFRFYVLQLQPLTATRFALFALYLLPFTAFFLMLTFTLHRTLRWRGRPSTMRSEMIASAIVLPAGFVVLEIINYVPLFVSGELALPGESLLTIIGYPFIVVLAVVGALSTYFFHKTGTIYVGAFVSALLVTWNVVGGTAVQGDVQEWGGLAMTVRVILPLLLALVLVVVAVRLRRCSADRSEIDA